MNIGGNSGVNLNKFFEDVAKINKNLTKIEELHSKLRIAHEETKTAHNVGVSQTLKRAKLIRDRLKVLENSNEAS
ncbi:hypothetical protein RDABS01_015593 [Bienertia sinuspersici]